MKIHKSNSDLIFLEEILFVCMFITGVFHMTFGVLATRTTQDYLPLMVEILDIPFFVSFVGYTITTLMIKTSKNMNKPIYNWQKVVIIAISITILLLSLELFL